MPLLGRWGTRRKLTRKASSGGASESVIRLEPAGNALPEKRSTTRDVGDLVSGQIVNILAPSSSSGAAVNESSALGVSAVLACVRLLSDMVAKLPIELYRKTGRGPRQVLKHPGVALFGGIPSDMHSSFELRKLLMTGKGLGGNGYARVYRDAYDDPRAIEWLEPCRVQPKTIIRSNGQRFLAFEVEGEKELLTRRDVIHIKGESRDGVCGISPVTLLRENIGTALAQTSAAGALMKNGTQFPGFLTTSANLTKDQITDARDEFNANYSGSRNNGRVPVLNGTFDFKQTNGMSMVDAQFIESRRFELQEVARHYGIPPFLIGDSTASTTWGTGIEEQTRGFLNFCLDPHLKSFEEALAFTLLTTEEVAKGFYFRFDRDELASVSRQDTAAYFQTMRNIGVYSVNDIRSKLDEPQIAPEDGGDDYRLPLNSASKGTPEPQPADEETATEE